MSLVATVLRHVAIGMKMQRGARRTWQMIAILKMNDSPPSVWRVWSYLKEKEEEGGAGGAGAEEGAGEARAGGGGAAAGG